MRTSIWLLAFAGSLAIAADTTTAVASGALSNLPKLSTATEEPTTTATSDSNTSAGSTAESSSASSATQTSGAASTTTTKAAASSGATTRFAASSGSTINSASTTASPTTGSATTTSNNVFHLTDLPTIAGAGIPTLVIPYTAAAPFMQKSTYPEGTVFICIGAILGFLGLCVLAWRGIIAYSINRSVKRAALASIMATDAKTPGWLAGGTAMKKGPGGKIYKQPTDGSSLSLEALNVHGKKINEYAAQNRVSAMPTRKEQKRDPSGLFFSPTAAPGANTNQASRNSTYLPAGYYASSAAAPAGGAGTTTIGSYARTSPPGSPAMRPVHSHLRAPSNGDGSKLRHSFVGNTANRNSAPMLSPTYAPGGLYSQPSTSSLAVGFGHAGDETLPGQRAPSAYFDDILQEHGEGPRERF